MTIDSHTIISANEANRDFLRATRIADANGQAVIFKDDRPKYLLIDLDSSDYLDISDDEKIDIAAARILKRFRPAFEELAK